MDMSIVAAFTQDDFQRVEQSIAAVVLLRLL